MASRTFLVVALFVMLAFAGCLKKGPEVEGAVAPVANDTPTGNATLPEGRGESAGLLETNKTEEGVGGVEHKHDYWKGKDRVVLFDQDVTLTCPPCLPDGDGSDPKAVAYVKLGMLPDEAESEVSAMVYEGADSVEVLFSAPTTFSAAHPAPPGLRMQYRSASDADWTEPVAVAYDTPVVIPVTPQMTDMPHSTHSLWVWRLTTDRAEALVDVPMTVTVVKGRDVVDWPGHPDFYAEKNARVVMQQHVTTHMSGIESFALYDSGGTWANPEKLISWGTKEILVIINITGSQNAYGAEPTDFFLEAHNATIIGPEITFGGRFSEMDGKNDLKTYQFALPVDEAGMDGPYQPASRWGFRAMATFATLPENPVINGLCPGCFPYDIEYDITVIALDHETGKAAEWDEPV